MGAGDSCQFGLLLYALAEANLLEMEIDRFSQHSGISPIPREICSPLFGGQASRLATAMSWVYKDLQPDKNRQSSRQVGLFYDDTRRTGNFYSGNDAAAVATVKALAERYDLSAYRMIVDVAGGSSALAMGIT